MQNEQGEQKPDVGEQAKFWNSWNAQHREQQVGLVSERQSATVLGWMTTPVGTGGLDILEVGCGSGWMCERLVAFGRVAGIDFADDVIKRAQARAPHIRFIAGDFMSMDLSEFEASADVVVSLEVLSHVPDQAEFIRRISALLRPNGHLILATQNRFVLERSAGVTPRAPGQIRKWVNARELRSVLEPGFDVLQLTSVLPYGHNGVLRLINSPRLNNFISKLVPQARIDRLKEYLLLGLFCISPRKGIFQELSS
jgi:2-polyprenyl-3-methyl-5-hydroxy-6-metoxy-1,4-benzoquinol methylase